MYILLQLTCITIIIFHASFSGSKWDTSFLTWKVKGFPSHLSHSEVLHTLKQAFKVWSDVTNLYFQYIEQGEPDIVVCTSKEYYSLVLV